MLDVDLARLYGVTTKVLNQAVRRNANRFPDDFMLQLTEAELADLNRSQIVTGSQKHRDPRFLPFAFTEQGVAMLSGVLRSKQAVEANIEIMRAFVRLRKLILSHVELSAELAKLEQSVATHDRQIRAIFEAIQKLISPATRKTKQIGFRARSSTN